MKSNRVGGQMAPLLAAAATTSCYQKHDHWLFPILQEHELVYFQATQYIWYSDRYHYMVVYRFYISGAICFQTGVIIIQFSRINIKKKRTNLKSSLNGNCEHTYTILSIYTFLHFKIIILMSLIVSLCVKKKV